MKDIISLKNKQTNFLTYFNNNFINNKKSKNRKFIGKILIFLVPIFLLLFSFSNAENVISENVNQGNNEEQLVNNENINNDNEQQDVVVDNLENQGNNNEQEQNFAEQNPASSQNSEITNNLDNSAQAEESENNSDIQNTENGEQNENLENNENNNFQENVENTEEDEGVENTQNTDEDSEESADNTQQNSDEEESENQEIESLNSDQAQGSQSNENFAASTKSENQDTEEEEEQDFAEQNPASKNVNSENQEIESEENANLENAQSLEESEKEEEQDFATQNPASNIQLNLTEEEKRLLEEQKKKEEERKKQKEIEEKKLEIKKTKSKIAELKAKYYPEELNAELPDFVKDNKIYLDSKKDLYMIVRQSSNHTCGQASLATLFSQIGEPKTEKQISDITGLNKEKGVNMLALKKAAQSFNKEVYLKRWTFEELKVYLEESKNPVLIHDIKKDVGEHFSVIRKIENNFVFLSDTEAGNIKYSVEDFKKVYTGNTLVFGTSEQSKLLLNILTNISDIEAANIWGKYVPVYEVVKNLNDTKGKKAVKTFEICLKKATKKYAFKSERREQYEIDRNYCYSNLKSNKDFKKYITNPEYIKQVEEYRKIHWREHQDEDHEIKLELENYDDLFTVVSKEIEKLIIKNKEKYKRGIADENLYTNYLVIWKQRLLETQEKLKNINNNVVYYNGQKFTLGQLQNQITATVSKIDRLSKAINSKYSSVEEFEKYKAEQIAVIKREIQEITNKVAELARQKRLYESGQSTKLTPSEERNIKDLENQVSVVRNDLKSYERSRDSYKAKANKLENKKRNSKTSKNPNYIYYNNKYNETVKKANETYDLAQAYLNYYYKYGNQFYADEYEKKYKIYKNLVETAKVYKKLAEAYEEQDISSWTSSDQNDLDYNNKKYKKYKKIISKTWNLIDEIEDKIKEIKTGSNKNKIDKINSDIAKQKQKIKVLSEKLKTLQSTSAEEDLKDLTEAKREKQQMEAIVKNHKKQLKGIESTFKSLIPQYEQALANLKKANKKLLNNIEELEEEASKGSEWKRKKEEGEFKMGINSIKLSNRSLQDWNSIIELMNICSSNTKEDNHIECEKYPRTVSVGSFMISKYLLVQNSEFNEKYISLCLDTVIDKKNKIYCNAADQKIINGWNNSLAEIWKNGNAVDYTLNKDKWRYFVTTVNREALLSGVKFNLDQTGGWQVYNTPMYIKKSMEAYRVYLNNPNMKEEWTQEKDQKWAQANQICKETLSSWRCNALIKEKTNKYITNKKGTKVEVWTPRNTNFIGLDMEKGLNRETLEWGYLRNLKTEILKENQKARTCENKGYNVIYNPVGRNFTCWDNNKNKLARLDSSGYLYWVPRSLRTTPEEDLKLKYNLQDYTDITTEKGKAYAKCRITFGEVVCDKIKYEREFKEEYNVVRFIVSDSRLFHENKNHIYIIVPIGEGEIRSSLKNSIKRNNYFNEYYLNYKKEIITPKCKKVIEDNWIWLKSKLNVGSNRKQELINVCESNNLVYNPSNDNWVILKSAINYDLKDAYPISFDWNGNLLHPKEGEVIVEGQWIKKETLINGILYKYKVLNDKFNNQVNIAFDYTVDTADGINGIWKVGEGATKIINANNTLDLENGISIFTEGKEKLDRNGGKIIEVIEGISNASDVATAGSLLVCVETAGGGCVAAGGSWAIKKGTLYFGGKKAKRIVRKYFGEKGFRSIKKKIERKILRLLRSGKIKWQDVNRFFQKTNGAFDRLLGNELALAGVSKGSLRTAKVKETKSSIFKSTIKGSGINILWSNVTKPKFIDKKLKKFADELYRDGAIIGNGSTADAIRYTKKTGELVGNSNHIQKGIDSVRFLKKWLENNPGASNSDINSVKRVINDINNALNGN